MAGYWLGLGTVILTGPGAYDCMNCAWYWVNRRSWRSLAPTTCPSALLRRLPARALPDPHHHRVVRLDVPFHRFDQVVLKSGAAELAVGIDVDPGGLLALQGMQDSRVLDDP